MLSLGVETWSKSLHKVGFTRKARVLLGLQGQTPGFPASGPRRQGPWRLAPGLRKTSFCAFQKPCGLSPLAQIKCSRTQTFRETSGTPSSDFRKPSGDQTLLSHISNFISGPFRSSSSCPLSQHSVTNIHNSYNTISSTNVKRADPTGSRTM